MKNINIKSTKKFQTIFMSFVFPFEEKEEDIAKYYILPALLMYSNYKYKTEDSFKKAKIKNYVLSYNVRSNIIGTSGCFTFNIAIPNTHSIIDLNLKNIFSFVKDCIYKPNITNNGFISSEIKREIEIIKLKAQNKEKELTGFLDLLVPRTIDDEGILKRSIYNNMDQLDKITPKNLYQFYQKNIQTKCPYIFIVGDVSKKEMTDLCLEYFDFNKDLVISQKSYYHFLKVKQEKTNMIKLNKDFKESAISMCFKFENISPKDQMRVYLLNRILASNVTHLLFNKLRTEAGLVYSVDTINRFRYNVFEIVAYANKDNLDIIKKKVLEVLAELKNPIFMDDLLKKIVADEKLLKIGEKDYQINIMDDLINDYFESWINSKKQLSLIKKTKAKDIINLVNRMKLDTCFYVMEMDNE